MQEVATSSSRCSSSYFFRSNVPVSRSCLLGRSIPKLPTLVPIKEMSTYHFTRQLLNPVYYTGDFAYLHRITYTGWGSLNLFPIIDIPASECPWI